MGTRTRTRTATASPCKFAVWPAGSPTRTVVPPVVKRAVNSAPADSAYEDRRARVLLAPEVASLGLTCQMSSPNWRSLPSRDLLAVLCIRSSITSEPAYITHHNGISPKRGGARQEETSGPCRPVNPDGWRDPTGRGGPSSFCPSQGTMSSCHRRVCRSRTGESHHPTAPLASPSRRVVRKAPAGRPCTRLHVGKSDRGYGGSWASLAALAAGKGGPRWSPEPGRGRLHGLDREIRAPPGGIPMSVPLSRLE